jgi:Glycosyl transferase family 2/Methyltransferase domain
MRKLRNIFACLVHESQECIIELVRNLKTLDPGSAVLLYNGSADPNLLHEGLGLAGHGVQVHPSPRPLSWGRLHEFAIDCMQFAFATDDFDVLTIVDSDQLCLRRGYSEYLTDFLNGRSRVGLIGNSPAVQTVFNAAGPAIAAHQEAALWRSFLRRFPGGEQKFVHWCFWPSTVFTRDVARELVDLFRNDSQLRQIVAQTKIWASEEVILPTLVRLLGFEYVSHPCSYDYVRYRVSYSLTDAEIALSRPDVFWIHPIPRRYDDPLRAHLRRKHREYENVPEKSTDMTSDPSTNQPPLLLTLPILARMRTIEGWLEDDEADVLIGALSRAVSTLRDVHAIVEVGSYCGRATVVLASVLRSLQIEKAKVYAIDPHDGKLGALDKGIKQVEPSWEKFARNIAAAGLTKLVEGIRGHAFDLQWDKPACFVLIDGLHDYANVARDFLHFEAWLVCGGYVAFHDYASYYPGVVKFVNELLASGGYQRVSCSASLIVLQKTGERPRIQVAQVDPLISCLMPTANRRAFVPKAIRYFLRQDYANRELIILDDGSDPVSDLIPTDPRIRYIRMQERSTMGAKHNLGCEHARGEIIAHWDDDDWFAEWRLSYQVSELVKHPPMTLSGLSRILFYRPSDHRAWEYVYPKGMRPWVCGSTFCYRKEFWVRHQFPNMNEGADTSFVWGLNDAGIVSHTDSRWMVGIVHSGNTSPKRTSDPAWRSLPPEEVGNLLGPDILLYESQP